MKNKLNLNSSAEFSSFNRKKNPRDMTVQELDEYIKKNRQKNYIPYHTESKSLNSSFSSNNNFGYFNETKTNKDKNLNSENRNLKTTSFPQQNIEIEKSMTNKKLNENKIKKDNENIIKKNNINNPPQLSNLIQDFVKNSPFIKNNTSNRINTMNNEENENKFKSSEEIKQKYLNYSPNSEQNKIFNNTFQGNLQNNFLKWEQTSLPNNNININNIKMKYKIDNNNYNSNINLTNNVKSLQEQIKQLINENEMLKQNLNNIQSILESERNNRELNKNIKEEELLKRNNDLQLQLNIQLQNINLLEKEKNRHIEQNAIDKENYLNEINTLKEQLSIINNQYKEKCEESEKIRNQFENERNEMIETMKSLREIIFQKETENNSIMDKYDKLIKNQQHKKENFSNSMISTNSKKSKENIFINNNKVNNKRTKSSKKNTINKNSINLNQKINNQNLKTNKNIRDKTPKKNLSKNKGKNVNKMIKNLNNNNYNNDNYLIKQENQNYSNIILGELNSLRSDYSDLNSKNNINKFYFNNQENDKINIQNKEELLNKINESIFNLERIIPELTRDYKNIVSRINSNLFPQENITLKNNLKLISNEIENNNSQLNELKTQQQEILKYILSQNGNL